MKLSLFIFTVLCLILSAKGTKNVCTDGECLDKCFWTVCTGMDQKMTGCYHYGSGSRSDLARASMQLAVKANKLLVAECIRPNETSELEWDRLITGFPIIGEKPQ